MAVGKNRSQTKVIYNHFGRLSNVSTPLLMNFEKKTSSLLTYASIREPSSLSNESSDPLSLNLHAIHLLQRGRLAEALESQQLAVNTLTNALGGTSDNYTDLAGALNDLGCILMANKRHLDAEKALKRALNMCERAYKVNTHLQLVLRASLMQMYHLSGRANDSLEEADKLQKLLTHPQRNLTAQNAATIWTNEIWSYVRTAQCHLSLALTASTLRTAGEGVIFLNHAASLLNPHSTSSLSTALTPSSVQSIESTRLMLIASLLTTFLHIQRLGFLRVATGHSPNPTISSVSTAHIKIDHLAALGLSVPSGDSSVVPVTLSSGIRAIETAVLVTIQRARDTLSKPEHTASSAPITTLDQLSYLGVPFYPCHREPLTFHIMGAALLDAEYHSKL